MEVDVEETELITLRRLDGGDLLMEFTVDRLDAVNALAFREAFNRLIPEGALNVRVDMSRLRHVDSSGIGAMIGLLKRIGVRGELRLYGLGPAVARAFAITRMDKIFSINGSLQDAAV